LGLEVYTNDETDYYGDYTATLTGTLSGDAMTAYTTFTIQIRNRCYPQTISAPSVSSTTTYQIDAATVVKVLPVFPISNTGLDCTTITYSLDSALDSSVWSFDTSTRELSIYTTDSSYIGTWEFTYEGDLDVAVWTYTTFTITIHSKCYG
jgi:hypothetical protein